MNIELLKKSVKKVPVLNKAARLLFKSRLWEGCRSALEDKVIGIHSLNIGGGPDFRAIGWMNLDSATGAKNLRSFKLSPGCVFPLNDSAIKNVYTSHCLEHLDEKTVSRILNESARVLKGTGRIVVKIPDFDLVLNAWKENDASLFIDELWDYDSIVDTWGSRNINDRLDYRAAVIFCGFWNSSYGDHFSRKITKNSKAYHGPAVVDVGFLRELIKDSTPSEISAALSKIVIENEKEYHFNHRSAWSRSELETILTSSGFQVVTFDKEIILKECRDFPLIEDMKMQSLYCLAVKR